MLEICSLLLAGLLAGWLIRARQDWIRLSDRFMTAFVYLMLFLLGLGVGTNPEIMRNIRSLGLQAIGITVFGLLGSIAAGLLCARLLSRHHEG